MKEPQVLSEVRPQDALVLALVMEFRALDGSEDLGVRDGLKPAKFAGLQLPAPPCRAASCVPRALLYVSRLGHLGLLWLGAAPRSRHKRARQAAADSYGFRGVCPESEVLIELADLT
jgi:hypothetical protein